MQSRLPAIWYYRDDYLRIRLEPHEISREESPILTTVRKQIAGQILEARIPNHMMGPGLAWAPAQMGRREGDNITIELPAPDGGRTTWTIPETELEKLILRDNGETRTQSRMFP